MKEYKVFLGVTWVGSVYATSLREAKKTAKVLYAAVMKSARSRVVERMT